MTIVASGWARRCSMNAAMSRIGPSTLVVTTDSAAARKDSGWCQSSRRMMPAIATRTLRSGCWAMTSFAADSMLAGSAVSTCTVPRPGCSAASCSSSPARLPPMMTVFPRACSSTARASPMPLVEPGMKTVFPEMFMLRVLPTGGRGAESGYRGIGGPWLGPGHRPIMGAWTGQRWPTSCAGAARRCSPGTSGFPRVHAAGPGACGARRSPRCGDVGPLLHPPGAAARPAAERADARLARPGAAADQRRARLPVPDGGS